MSRPFFKTSGILTAGAAALALGGCVTAPPTQSGFLQSYEQMQTVEDDGAAQSKSFRNAERLKAVSAVRIVPAESRLAADGAFKPEEIASVQAEIDRELCRELSESFRIEDGAPEVEVRAAITEIAATGAASSVISAAASRFIPGPGSVRLPVGLGGLSAEAEVRDPASGEVLAALSWSRRAQVVLDQGSLSRVGDAHQMAEPFADAVAKLMRVEGAVMPANLNRDVCPGFGAGDAGRFIAARAIGLHVVGGAPVQEATQAPPTAAGPVNAAPAPESAPKP